MSLDKVHNAFIPDICINGYFQIKSFIHQSIEDNFSLDNNFCNQYRNLNKIQINLTNLNIQRKLNRKISLHHNQ